MTLGCRDLTAVKPDHSDRGSLVGCEEHEHTGLIEVVQKLLTVPNLPVIEDYAGVLFFDPVIDVSDKIIRQGHYCVVHFTIRD